MAFVAAANAAVVSASVALAPSSSAAAVARSSATRTSSARASSSSDASALRAWGDGDEPGVDDITCVVLLVDDGAAVDGAE